MSTREAINKLLQGMTAPSFGPLDLLPQEDLVEKLIELDLQGAPVGPDRLIESLEVLAKELSGLDTDAIEVVVFGGGTGLSNVIGGDSRSASWPRAPFNGIKEIFSKTRSVVCVTDDGGSTGELFKDFPIIALGDLRHVLLSSIQDARLKNLYGLNVEQALLVAQALHGLFNFRFSHRPVDIESLIELTGSDLAVLPATMREGLLGVLEFIFQDSRFVGALSRPHCLGNLLLAGAIYQAGGEGQTVPPAAIIAGIDRLAELIGSFAGAVLPCTTTPANIKAMYANGVLVTGEYRSSQARRGYPIDRVFVEFAHEPQVPEEVLAAVARAQIIVFAPGSLYTSIIPILQVPRIAAAVRANSAALKILVSNLWIQKGETDLVREDPRRRFYVSDQIKAYHRNIPGGIEGLFDALLVLGLHDIPGSILQNYALENKVPIFLDKERVRNLGCNPVEARIFSREALRERHVIQHDPDRLARAIRTVWACRDNFPTDNGISLPPFHAMSKPVVVRGGPETAYQRLGLLRARLDKLTIAGDVRDSVEEILWRYPDIPPTHLDCTEGVELVPTEAWPRDQKWDNIFSFYDPQSRVIKIRHDVSQRPYYFEMAFMVALGQSLLGDYAALKEMQPLELAGERLGRIYRLQVRDEGQRCCYLTAADLDYYLELSRMKKSDTDPHVFTRIINADEGFTPPGMFFGLTYAWYMDNRLATHIEYKMTIFRMGISELIPYQTAMYNQRQELVDFFRKVVFGHSDTAYEEGRGEPSAG